MLEVAAHALAGTFCEECYLGICTHGDQRPEYDDMHDIHGDQTPEYDNIT